MLMMMMMPPLEPITQEEAEEEEMDDDPELIPDEETKNQRENINKTIDYDKNIGKWRSTNVKQEEELDQLKRKGKGKTLTKKDILVKYIEKLMMTGQWTNEVNDKLSKVGKKIESNER